MSAGATARKGELKKFRRYGPAVLPLCCDTYGRWGPSALRWWRELSKLVAETDPDLAGRGSWAQADLLSRWWAETSVALQRANADAVFAAVNIASRWLWTRDRAFLTNSFGTKSTPYEFLVETVAFWECYLEADEHGILHDYNDCVGELCDRTNEVDNDPLMTLALLRLAVNALLSASAALGWAVAWAPVSEAARCRHCRT